MNNTDFFNNKKPFQDYIPKDIMRMIMADDNSYYYADSSSVYGPDALNGNKINSILYTSEQIQNYRFGVDEVFIFNDLWDVNPYNNKINITVGATTYNITIPNGRYKLKASRTDIKSLAIAIENAINASAGVGAFVVDVANGVLTLTKSIAGNFTVSYPTPLMEKYGTKLHGIKSGTYTTTYTTTPNFSYTDNIYFKSSINRYSKFDETGFNAKSNIVSNVLLKRDKYSADTNEQIYEPMMMKWFKVNETISTGSFDVQLLDDFDNPLYIQDTSNFKYLVRFLIKNIPN